MSPAMTFRPVASLGGMATVLVMAFAPLARRRGHGARHGLLPSASPGVMAMVLVTACLPSASPGVMAMVLAMAFAPLAKKASKYFMAWPHRH
jgi:hypothetical protein